MRTKQIKEKENCEERNDLMDASNKQTNKKTEILTETLYGMETELSRAQANRTQHMHTNAWPLPIAFLTLPPYGRSSLSLILTLRKREHQLQVKYAPINLMQNERLGKEII